MRYFTVFFLFIVLFVGVLLGWVGNSRISDFYNTHVAIATETTSSVNEAITRFIAERRRFVTVFTVTHKELLTELVKDPEDSDVHNRLVEKLTLYFPKHFAYTMVNQVGKPLFEDFDGLVGAQCKQDLEKFAETKEHLPKVHPNSEMYHFDIMVPFETEGRNFVFFLSFDADLLAEILQNATVPHHELMLVLPQENRKLIEVTTTGSRVHLNRDDFRMQQDEMQRILASKTIDGSAWQVIDLRSEGLVEEFSYKVYLFSGMMFVIFLLIATLWYRHALLAERIRREADQHKSEFLSTVSHELRTPLTAIKGSIGLIAGGVSQDVSEQTRKLSTIALNNTDRLISIVNDLLDIQKIEAGKLSLEVNESNLTELIQQSLDSMQAYGKQFNVSYQLLDLLPNTVVKVDSGRFVQVMNNLISNATKYGKHDDVVEISIIPYQNQVRVSVTDHGCGIPEEFRNKVFSKFAQAKNQNNMNKKVESTGLGLHIVKQLVTMMGGQINFYTSEIGTTFYIDLKIYNQN